MASSVMLPPSPSGAGTSGTQASAAGTGTAGTPPPPSGAGTSGTQASAAGMGTPGTPPPPSGAGTSGTQASAAGMGTPGTPPPPSGAGTSGTQRALSNEPSTQHLLARAGGDEIPAAGAALGPYTRVGSTTNFDVSYDNSLGVNGNNLANAVLANCERDYAQLQGWFGGVTAGRFGIFIDPGSFGAYHANCSATDLHLAAFAGTDAGLVNMLDVAEADEVFMARQNAGWNCGYSNGEGLSRVLATQLYPASLDGFASASTWMNTPGRPDYIATTEQTDRDYVSIGCSTLFLNFLRHQLRFSWQQIVRAGAPTLAQTYTKLTGRTDALTRFKSLLQAHYPEGTPVTLGSDNVFPIPGLIEVFARGGDGAVWHNVQTAPNNGWSGWYSLGGWIDLLEAAQNDDGRLEIFARGGDGALWHNWQLAPAGSWSGWYSMGGWIDLLDVGRNADGRLEIFARGGDGALWHNWQTAPSNGWSGWYSLGGWIDLLEVARNDDGRLEIFARGGDGALWHIWQTAPNNGWSGWYSMGGWIDRLEVGKNADGRLEIFARGGDGALWHNWQTAPSNGWSGWYSLGGWIDLLEAGENDDGRMEIFARGGDGAVWHNWQTAPNNGWSGWYSMGGWIDRLDVGHNADGRMEIFARGGDGALWHNWQTAPSNGWSGWYSLGGWIDMLEVWPENSACA
jgi:hypothetical protein